MFVCLVLLPVGVLGQKPVVINFQTNPVLSQTGTDAVFTLLNLPSVLTITWLYENRALGVWAGGTSTVEPPPQFQGRVSITANTLRIGSAQLRDAGSYQAMVLPTSNTNLSVNTGSVQLRVFGKR